MHSTSDIVQQLKHEEQQGLLRIKKTTTSPSTPLEINPKGIHQVLNLLADPAVIVNTNGKLLWTNHAITTVTHYKKEEFIGKNFFKLHLISRKSKALMVKNLTQRVLGFNIKPYIIEIFTKEQQKLFFEINAKIINYNGQKADLNTLFTSK